MTDGWPVPHTPLTGGCDPGLQQKPPQPPGAGPAPPAAAPPVAAGPALWCSAAAWPRRACKGKVRGLEVHSTAYKDQLGKGFQEGTFHLHFQYDIEDAGLC